MNIGIDIGGSHIGIGLVENSGNVVKKIEKKITYIEKNDIKEFLIKEIKDSIKILMDDNDVVVEKIGIGIPGIVKDDIIQYSVNLGVSNYDLKSELQKEFPNIKIHIRNDAKCAGLAEKNLGALNKFKDCVFICLGTGIGGATFFNNSLLTPKRGSGFEFGHMIIQRNGELCRCGSKGCFELYGSMRKFKNDIRFVLNLSSELDGEELLNKIYQNKEDIRVNEVIDEYIDNVCIGISNIVDIFEPQAVCIGGSFVYYEDLLLNKLRNKFYNSEYVFNKEDMPKIVMAKYKNDAGIIGSALYA